MSTKIQAKNLDLYYGEKHALKNRNKFFFFFLNTLFFPSYTFAPDRNGAAHKQMR